jgi:hypothetical protein
LGDYYDKLKKKLKNNQSSKEMSGEAGEIGDFLHISFCFDFPKSTIIDNFFSRSRSGQTWRVSASLRFVQSQTHHLKDHDGIQK